MSQTSINHPDYRPGRGEKRSDREIALYAEAAQVWSVWRTIYTNRAEGRDAYDRVNREAITAVIAAGGILGTLVAEFVTDAETRALPKPWTVREQVAETAPWIDYTVAGMLRARFAELKTPDPALIPVGYAEDTCSHGVAFTADCAACDGEA
jgi:hypothetical protein